MQMSRELPILFNTEMVRAILAGQKTCTRRLPNKRVREEYFAYDDWANTVGGSGIKKLSEKEFYEQYPPYSPGDILYVRETWTEECGKYYYRSDYDSDYLDPCETLSGGYPASCRNHPGCYGCTATSMRIHWHPSIHMPKEAARIWLKVTDVRGERLQDIDEDGVWDEGFKFKPPCLTRVSADGHTCDLDGPCTSSIKYCDMTMGELFGRELWNSTIKKSDLDSYGWDANPWVWVIEFERCDKEGRAVDGR
jgi:hypothetical protein